MALRDLVNSTADTMSLPQAMNALRNGEIEPPARDLPTVGALVSPAALPVQRKPQPPEWQQYLDEQTAAVAAQAEIDARELEIRMRARQTPQYDANGDLIRYPTR